MVFEFIGTGNKTGATARNVSFVAQYIQYASDIEDIQKYLCADPQTSGGLLFSISRDKVSDFIQKSKGYGVLHTAVIGEVKQNRCQYIYISCIDRYCYKKRSL